MWVCTPVCVSVCALTGHHHQPLWHAIVCYCIHLGFRIRCAHVACAGPTCEDEMFLPDCLLSFSFYLSSSSPHYITSTPLSSPPVPFVTAIVTWGCLRPTMHCNPSARLVGDGTAVTSTERREEERRKEERRGEVKMDRWATVLLKVQEKSQLRNSPLNLYCQVFNSVIF